jgi:hypothetical protein
MSDMPGCNWQAASAAAYTRFNPALATILNFRKTTMTTITTQQTAPAEPFSLMGIIETLFAIQLREQLNGESKGDQSDAAYTWGL